MPTPVIMNWTKLATVFTEAFDALDSQMESLMTTSYFTAVDQLDRFKSGELSVGMMAGVDQLNQEGLQPLHYAIKVGNVEAVDWLLGEHAAPVLGRSELESWNSAHFAVHYKQCSLLDRLNAAADDKRVALLTAQDAQGRTPLLLALQESEAACVSELIRLQTPLNTLLSGRKRETYLHAAIRSDTSPQTFELLLRASLAQIDVRDATGLSPVNLAAAEGQLELFKLLVLYGADLMSVDGFNSNIFHQVRSSQLMRLLIHGPLPIKSFPDLFDRNQLIKNPDGKVFSEAQLEAMLGAVNVEGLTPLMVAVLACQEEIVELLAATQSRGHINAVQPGSLNTALHLAVIGNKPNAFAVVQALLKSYPSIEAVNAEGKTAMVIAEANGMTEVVEELRLFDL